MNAYEAYRHFTVHLFLVLFILSISNKADCQLAQNTWMIGGNLAYQGSKYENVKQRDLTISPKIGYFIIDKLAAGINCDYTYDKFTTANLSSVSHVLKLGPFIRYYILKKESPINILGQLGYQYIQTLPNQSSPKEHFNGINAQAGPSFFFNNVVGMEVLLNYNYTANKDFTQNTLGLNVGLQIFLERG